MESNVRIDRRGLAIAALAGTAYLLFGAPWPLALGAFGLVYALNELFVRPDLRISMPPPGPQPGTPEAAWLQRAERAVTSIERLRRSARSTVIAQRCESIAEQARQSVAALRRLTYQAGVVSGVGRSRDTDALGATERRLQLELAELTGARRDEVENTLASVVAQREAAERLELTRRDLQRRIETSALGLESVVGRVAEIVAMTDETSRATPVQELVEELDTLRAALGDTEGLGHGADDALLSHNEEGR